ncbi:response regulator transcription factor [Bacillus cereus]|uniref:response regulator transcription factor n=1 Tax=Bacillus cereus TaxID=1396 RepID=UPI002AC1EB62|nr:response regulator transcription factor [Bacillus cereus]MDZ4417408.1 response regulator transcription factor [Bacillus cereus]
MKLNILIISDEGEFQKLAQNGFISNKCHVITTNDGIDGIIQFQKQHYDLIILNGDLPHLDGYNICKIIRSQSNVPIIMITSTYSEKNAIKAFQLGVDDYITQPFSFEILLNRAKAVLRRVNTTQTFELIQFEDISLNPDAFVVYIKGEKKKLTTKEFKMLHTFIKNPGRVLSRDVLLNEVWGEDYYGGDRIIDVYVKELRKKLKIPYIKTIVGVGYKIDSLGKT